MVYQFRVSSAARDDMAVSATWYNEQQQDLGKEFLNEVFSTFQKIEQDPFMYAVRFSGRFRFAKVSRFPFLVVYQILGDRIIINAVFHTSRNPKGR